jgi:hypothetical protein
MNAPDHSLRPLCFVLMPFGQKPDASGAVIDFDVVYSDLIKPAIEKARLKPIRADEEMAGGIIHKPMFERLLLCEYAVADLTTANANVFYELGIRHAVRPWSTVLIFAENSRLPFDLGPLRGMPYGLDAAGKPSDPTSASTSLAVLLEEARQKTADSPIFQLVEDLPPPDLSGLEPDLFRKRIDHAEGLKEKLARASQVGPEAIRAVEKELGPLEDAGSGVLIDLMLSYRAVKAWKEMIDLVEAMPEPLARTVLVREQFALALNRDGQGEKAERVLLELLEDRGPSSETYGILGRIYKDRWQAARDEGREILAKGLLRKAVDAYLEGFQTDWRDAYPGINAVTLMELCEPPDPRRKELLPVVTYSVRRRIAAGRPDYWDYATLLELAVLGEDPELASTVLPDALAAVREEWEPETTLRNLRLIRQSRETRGDDVGWLLEVEEALASSTRSDA